MKLEKGQVYRVFEVTKDIYNRGVLGKSFVEDAGYLFNNYGVNLCTGSEFDHYGIDQRNHARQVGRLIIKEVK